MKMKCIASIAFVFCVFIAVCRSAPLDTSIQASASVSTGGSSSGGGGGGLTNVLQNIDLPGLLRGVNAVVGLIRQFCPPLSQILDNVIQNVTSTAFRIFGRAILQSGGLGGGNRGSGGGSQSVNVVLPTFPPDEDYDEDEETSETSVDLAARAGNANGAEVGGSASLTVSANAEENSIAKRHVRVVREAKAEPEPEAEAEAEGDQNVAESAPEPSEDDLSNVDTEDADRNKRFLPFGGGHGSGGGSGNFLFDIIRNTADRAGRTLGTVYRMVAGTQNFDFGFSTSKQLVAGSGATDDGDKTGGVAEVDIAKGADGYTEGIPGPITRLFVIANRGIANLVQDLILRLAQTSERLVNFKARLITALI